MKTVLNILAVAMAVWGSMAAADSLDARCDIYPRGEDQASAMIPCTFGQRRGYVTITRDDGIIHDLMPVGDTPGNFRDQDGRPAYRESGLGDQGLIFRFEGESVYVYWDSSALNPSNDVNNSTAPFSTADYDATTLLRCRAAAAPEFDSCPAGILRMEEGQASIVVRNPQGDQFTINFMSNYVNATNREVEAKLQGDTWIVTIEKTEVYEVPLAALEGG